MALLLNLIRGTLALRRGFGDGTQLVPPFALVAVVGLVCGHRWCRAASGARVSGAEAKSLVGQGELVATKTSRDTSLTEQLLLNACETDLKSTGTRRYSPPLAGLARRPHTRRPSPALGLLGSCAPAPAVSQPHTPVAPRPPRLTRRRRVLVACVTHARQSHRRRQLPLSVPRKRHHDA